MLAASFMNKAGRIWTRATATLDAYGAAPDAYTVGDAVWCGVSTPTQRIAMIGERLGAPVTAMLTVHPNATVTAGNRIVVTGRTYDIIGVDDTAPDVWHAALSEVV